MKTRHRKKAKAIHRSTVLKAPLFGKSATTMVKDQQHGATWR
ncbi:hypothetical protein [Escherichia coli]|nr:hypothetical protein [Escherichia coli]